MRVTSVAFTCVHIDYGLPVVVCKLLLVVLYSLKCLCWLALLPQLAVMEAPLYILMSGLLCDDDAFCSIFQVSCKGYVCCTSDSFMHQIFCYVNVLCVISCSNDIFNVKHIRSSTMTDAFSIENRYLLATFHALTGMLQVSFVFLFQPGMTQCCADVKTWNLLTVNCQLILILNYFEVVRIMLSRRKPSKFATIISSLKIIYLCSCKSNQLPYGFMIMFSAGILAVSLVSAHLTKHGRMDNVQTNFGFP